MTRYPAQPKPPSDAIRLTTYEALEQYVEKIADHSLDLLLIVGRHGTGKSESVKRVFGERRDHAGAVLYVEGHAQPFGIYRGLWIHRDQPVVLDDVDKLYSNPECVRLLKPLCDTRERKRISWLTNATISGSGPPPAFETSSPVVLIANEWRSLNANVRALEDRAIIVHFDPSNDAVHRQVKAWCDDAEVYEFIGLHLRAVATVSMRWYSKAQRLRAAGFRDWRESILQMMLADRNLAVLADVLADPELLTDRARVVKFRDRTGLSRATYYRLKKRLAGRASVENDVA